MFFESSISDYFIYKIEDITKDFLNLNIINAPYIPFKFNITQ